EFVQPLAGELVGEGLDAELGKALRGALGVVELEAAEAADVVVEEFAAIGEAEAHGDVAEPGVLVRAVHDQPAGHPEVHDDRPPALDLDDDLLGAPPDVGEAPPPQLGPELLGRGSTPEDVGGYDVDLG